MWYDAPESELGQSQSGIESCGTVATGDYYAHWGALPKHTSPFGLDAGELPAPTLVLTPGARPLTAARCRVGAGGVLLCDPVDGGQ